MPPCLKTDKMAELSPEEFKKSLFTTFRSRGVLEALKSQLRNRLIKELQETAGKDDLAELHGQSENTETVCKLAANSLVADHLKRCNYEYSLSVFMPESGLQEHKLLTMRDILLLLKIREGSELYKNMEIVLDKHGSSNGLLVEFLSALGVSNDHGKSSKAVQASLKQLSSIEDKLQSVERQYLKNLQTENQKWSSQTEKWLLGLHKQWEHDKKKLLEEELGYLKATELARVRFEEKEKYQREVQTIRKQLEEKYAAKAEKLKADEREKLQLLSTQQQLQEEEAHAQRQKLLEDMLSLKQRETEFDLNHQMKAKTLKLEEERINVLSQELKIKKSLLEDAEANFNRRLDEEVQRYKLKCDEESHDRRQTLELREKRLQRDLDGFERKQGVYINTSDELQRTKGKLKELQIQLDDNKTQLALALQQKEMMSIKLSEDLEAIKERDDALAKENAILNRNLLKYEDEEKGNQRLISELREKSMESAADLLHLRDQLKQMEKTAKSKEKSWKDYKTKMESRLDEECQKRLKYQQLYEETMMSQSALNQEVADLKLTLQQTQQVLDVELGRRRANSIPCMESMPSELESPAVNTTQWEGDRTSVTDSAMDETSSTVVMIAQSKELFDRLEKEAKELEESYQKFQSRINQMELDVHSTSRSPDLHYPTQNLHGNTSFD
ncbi:oral-facial-digital syndrome 1 protein homolog isoform X3 [Pocillopora damicornis]|nr:oral-facial-digital syndrome 1 protein homolog isoform X3 [Pocillopora damicornis]